MPEKDNIDFDDYAENYEKHIDTSVQISGESGDYFDKYKIDCINRWIHFQEKDAVILDFGCGVGKLTKLIAESFPGLSVHGFDVSSKSVSIASKKWAHLENLVFQKQLSKTAEYDLITIANVFHHINHKDRRETLFKLRNLLKSNGKIVVFEHNPYNPLTRYVVKNCPFDADAELIYLNQMINLAEECGLECLFKRYIVFFPKFLKLFRKLEPPLGFLPLGAQYIALFGKAEN